MALSGFGSGNLSAMPFAHFWTISSHKLVISSIVATPEMAFPNRSLAVPKLQTDAYQRERGNVPETYLEGTVLELCRKYQKWSLGRPLRGERKPC